MNTEHVLLALGEVEDSVAAQILRDLGAPPAAVREQLAGMLGVEPERLRPRSRRRRCAGPRHGAEKPISVGLRRRRVPLWERRTGRSIGVVPG